VPDFIITTTADFDAGIKSESLGEYEVETNSDNPEIPADQIQLANMYGDSFTKTRDLTTDTFKHNEERIDPGGRTGLVMEHDINITESGKYRNYISYPNQTVTGTGSVVVRISRKKRIAPTSDFVMIMKGDFSYSSTGSGQCFARLQLHDLGGATASFLMVYRVGDPSWQRAYFFIRFEGVNQVYEYISSTAWTNLAFRARRWGSTVYVAYSIDGGSSWIERSWTGWADKALYINSPMCFIWQKDGYTGGHTIEGRWHPWDFADVISAEQKW